MIISNKYSQHNASVVKTPMDIVYSDTKDKRKSVYLILSYFIVGY